MILDVSGYLGVGIERVWKEVTFGANVVCLDLNDCHAVIKLH